MASSMSSKAAASCTINSARPFTVNTARAAGAFEPLKVRLGVALKICQRADVLPAKFSNDISREWLYLPWHGQATTDFSNAKY